MLTGLIPGATWWDRGHTTGGAAMSPSTGGRPAVRSVARFGLYVDPNTGSFVAESDGSWKRCGCGIMAAINAVLTERGSIPGNENFGAGPEPTHRSEFAKRDFERHADLALRDLIGLDFDYYEREVGWDEVGNLTRTIRVYRGNVDESESLPVE